MRQLAQENVSGASADERCSALELTFARADAQPVVLHTVAVGKNVHLDFQVHQLAERKDRVRGLARWR
jgi:hypothetical protein